MKALFLPTTCLYFALLWSGQTIAGVCVPCSPNGGVPVVCPEGAVALYVDASIAGSGDGTTWATAKKTLYEALNIANQCNAIKGIYIAQGAYKPTVNIIGRVNRDHTFFIGNAYSLYGGYAPGGSKNADPELYPTILDGGIGNAGPDDNSLHVVVLAGVEEGTVRLKGLTVRNGYASVSGEPDPLEIYPGRFVHNYRGGGMCVLDFSGDLVIDNCRFTGNLASLSAGGIFVDDSYGGKADIQNSVFSENTAPEGGGVYFGRTNIALNMSDTQFEGNIMEGYNALGGAAALSSECSSRSAFTRCEFRNNEKGHLSSGVTIFQVANEAMFLNCLFTGNSGYHGAAISLNGVPGLHVKLRNCVFDRNRAGMGPGQIDAGQIDGSESSLVAEQCVFYKTALGEGDSGYEIALNNVVSHFNNCTFYNQPTSTPRFSIIGTCIATNCIFWGQNEFWNLSRNAPTLINCIAQDTRVDGPGVLHTNPGFRSPQAAGADGTWLTADDGLQLTRFSPAVNRGSNNVVEGIDTDILSNPRIFNTTVDMGAYEFQHVSLPIDKFDLADNTLVEETFVYGGATALVDAGKIICSVTPSGGSPLHGPLSVGTWLESGVLSHNGISYARRHYDLTPASTDDATATITLYFTDDDFVSYNNAVGENAPRLPVSGGTASKPNLRIAQFHGPAGNNHGLPSSYADDSVELIDPDDADIVWRDQGTGGGIWSVTFNVSSFSGFFITTSGSGSLPVKLLSFDVAEQEGGALLSWSTGEEVNAGLFEIERSTDALEWEGIGKIMATGPMSRYQFADPVVKAALPVVYYRLKMTDRDGTFEYSVIRSLTRKSSFTTAIYPNPAADHIYLLGASPGAINSVRILSAGGTLVYAGAMTPAGLSIKHLPPGIYQVITSLTTGEVVRSKLSLAR